MKKRINGTTTYYLYEYDKVKMEKNVLGETYGHAVGLEQTMFFLAGINKYKNYGLLMLKTQIQYQQDLLQDKSKNNKTSYGKCLAKEGEK